jgi:RHH-type proline utilization regulon transcriptional repressor/proline dehydrogenase/delta 1-pyrroline-5-carboxylate dehydrogenase
MDGVTTSPLINWTDIDAWKLRDEDEAVADLLARAPLSEAERSAVWHEAERLVIGARKAVRKQGVLESFLQEFGLVNREGLALMCLAEALLRVPDADTQDALIAEKIKSGDWGAHLGQSDSMFVNASTWGLMLTGKIVDVEDDVRADVGGFMRRMVARLGEPVVRAAVMQAIRIMGEQFVLGRSIEAALKRAKTENSMCSFDMLGEGARTEADAERYAASYAYAIKAVAANSKGGPERGHGISVKLSALHPRYEDAHADEVFTTLYPRLKALCIMAAEADMNFCLDAEEADRLVLSLDILTRLASEPELGGWTGLGLAVQAYQKRAPLVIDRLAQLARKTGRRLMVRLVKGAYWDSEIKRAQMNGRPDYPVYTTKAATDLSYIVCAERLIAASPALYPQFATHNAYTLAAVRHMARAKNAACEFQRLHGMGEPLYMAAKDYYRDVTVRAYAPVGGHEDLLPYLVRRLLENGANSSFVHALLDENITPADVVKDPIVQVEAAGASRNPRIPTPMLMYGADRMNAAGDDLSNRPTREELTAAVARLDAAGPISAGPIVAGHVLGGTKTETVKSPTDRSHTVGTVTLADADAIAVAASAARTAQPDWDAIGGPGRAPVLRAMADALEHDRHFFIALLAREAGKTFADGIAEVREAVDFLRYYAALAEQQFGPAERLPGPAGETNHLSLHGRGVFACISPWNFPLAIFTGQIAAALAAGNGVLAKPAEQTPLVAFEAVKRFHAAGLDTRLLSLLPGTGEDVGVALTRDADIDGVAFTGSTDVARLINLTLAQREGPIRTLIAETGGLNGMFVDTSALKEQVVDDVILSAFGSAGQRCSALRILFLPEETADGTIETLKGAMDALTVGDPADTKTDVGPVIDEDARALLDKHLSGLRMDAKIHKQIDVGPLAQSGVFFGPTLAEITSLDGYDREVFGPILHVIRYKRDDLPRWGAELASKGYGLTLGVHSRLESFAADVQSLVHAGNTYVNRSIIGAVVGVQPFGGEGLSGTGPKAGGPHSLMRYATERAVTVNIAAQGGDPELINLG